MNTKKVSFLAAVAAFALASCGGNAGQGAAQDSAALSVDSAAAAVVAAGDSTAAAPAEAQGKVEQFLGKYQGLVGNASELIKKISGGDTSALGEYSKVADQLKTLQQEGEKLKSEMSVEQAKRFGSLVQQFATESSSLLGGKAAEQVKKATEQVQKATEKVEKAADAAKSALKGVF